MKARKYLALFSAAALSISAPAGVMAAESYQDAEKAALGRVMDSFSEDYTAALETYESELSASGVDITLEMTEGIQSMLSMMTGADFSWLNSLQLSGDVSMTDGKTAELIDLNLNGSKVCTLEYYVDSETLDLYMRIPELSEGYITMNMKDLLNEADTDVTYGDSSMELYIDLTQSMLGSSQSLSSLSDTLPQAETVTNVVDRYASILLEYMTGSESGTETLTVQDVSEECTTWEGTMTQQEAVPAMTELLSTARTDEDLKAFIETLAELSPESGISYEAFQSEIDSQLEDIASSDDIADDSMFITSKIWLNGEDRIVGREFSITDGDYTQPLLSWKAPSDGDSCGLLMEFYDEDSVYGFSGTGTLNGDLLDGYYEVYAVGSPVVGITVTGFDTARIEQEGVLNGTYSISMLSGVGEENYSILGSFGLDAAFAGGETDGSATFTLNNAGTPLLSLIIEATEAQPVEYPDPASLTEVYDFSSEDDMNAYLATITPDTILSNLTAAGMPEDFIESMLASGSEDDYYTEDDYSDEYDYSEDDYYSEDEYSSEEDYSDDYSEDDYSSEEDY